MLSFVALMSIHANALEVKAVVGEARVIDGDTLSISGKRIRLYGIDAPEGKQTCKDGNNRAWACGRAATKALRRMVANNVIHCRSKDIDFYGRLVAVCNVAYPTGHDVNYLMTPCLITRRSQSKNMPKQ